MLDALILYNGPSKSVPDEDLPTEILDITITSLQALNRICYLHLPMMQVCDDLIYRSNLQFVTRESFVFVGKRRRLVPRG